MPELTLPSDPHTVTVACDQADAMVQAAGWSDARRAQVVVAVGEAVGNAIEHGAGGPITVAMEHSADSLYVVVRDGGGGPTPAHLVRATLPDDPLATHGRGLYILRQLTDQLSVDGAGGLCLTFRR